MAAVESASRQGRMSLAYDDVLGWIRTFAAEVEANKEYLTQLDAAIGDADHGINMQRGMSAVLGKVDAASEERDVGALLKTVGMTLVSTVGGAGVLHIVKNYTGDVMYGPIRLRVIVIPRSPRNLLRSL